ncbi:MAG: PUA domain-containing protein [Candidatus Bathyarchaeia archaeon]|nr:pseudouridine synthase [Candidatus Bathyarchaeota archaeon]
MRGTMDKPTLWELRRIRGVANYQFGGQTGRVLFPKGVKVTRSQRTGRVRLIIYRGKVLATLRSSDGLLSLTIDGAKRLVDRMGSETPLTVKVKEGFEEFIKEGRSLFAKHVLEADPAIRPRSEVLIVDRYGRLLAVGKAVLSGVEMTSFRLGLAVKVRKGVCEMGRSSSQP